MYKLPFVGMCHVPPIVRSQQWKLIRCAYKARCPACWLKMCLGSFQMPASLKNSLANMLPENMRLSLNQTVDAGSAKRSDPISKQLIGWKPVVFENNFSRTTTFKSKIDKMTEKFSLPLKLENLNRPDIGCSKQKKLRKTRMKTRRSSLITTAPAAVILPECTKRQKVELKGPRVKHVCRSASIVLGQPVATFASDAIGDLPVKKNKEDESCDTCVVLNDKVNDSCKNSQTSSVNENFENLASKDVYSTCKAGKFCRNYFEVFI